MKEFIDTNINDYYISRTLISTDPFSSHWMTRAFYSAVDLDLQFLNVEKETLSERDFNKLKKTINKAFQLKHENIPNVYEIGEFRGRLFISTVQITGITLEEYLKQDQGLEFQQVMHIYLYLIDALRYAHLSKTYHNQINLKNIMIHDQKGFKPLQVYLKNFGFYVLKKYVPIPNQEALQHFQLYLAPERFKKGLNNESPLNDIYAMGVVFYQLLYRQTPFRLTSKNDLYVDKKNPRLKFPPYHGQALPKYVQTIIKKSIHPDPEQRFHSFKDIYQLL
ncbi:MAG: protein kinase, partial [Spirochaetes bacterium]|nr:protein kinase [Spirochaetota bacterium]